MTWSVPGRTAECFNPVARRRITPVLHLIRPQFVLEFSAYYGALDLTVFTKPGQGQQ